MENDRTLDPEESLELISKVIQDNKDNLKQNSFYFLLWGFLVGIACLLHYFLVVSEISFPPYIAWPVLMVAGGIISGVKGYSDSKRVGYETYTGMFTKNLWIGLGISLFIVLFLSSQMGVQPVGLILMISGAGTLITGLNIKFNPLILGGIVLFIGAIATVFVPGVEVLLLCAGALLLGYIIPGLMLRNAK
ncbi:MAG: hypothetical protein HKN79_00505 [Flavobacteriales bacterium]|nr:hypothetical protein [Flavobacteriales bacterium]